MDTGVDDYSITEHDLQDIIEASLTDDEIETWLREDFDLGPDAYVFQTFEQAGVEPHRHGMLLRFENGDTFEITITKTSTAGELTVR